MPELSPCGFLGCKNKANGQRVGVAFAPPPGTFLAAEWIEADVEICDDHARAIAGPLRVSMGADNG